MTLNLVPTEGLVIGYTHVKCEDPNSYQSKDMANVKVFADRQTDGPKTICLPIYHNQKKCSRKMLHLLNFIFPPYFNC